jgi:hypothetical protein
MKGMHHPDLLTARLIYKMLNFAFAESVPSYPRLAGLEQDERQEAMGYH